MTNDPDDRDAIQSLTRRTRRADVRRAAGPRVPAGAQAARLASDSGRPGAAVADHGASGG